MKLWSQLDSTIRNKIMPKSSSTVGEIGCLLCSLATLGQGDPLALMKIPNGFVNGGLLVTNVIANALGMSYVGSTTTAPKGWCIGRTDKYAFMGFPTHFLLVNIDTNQMVDPLKVPTKVETLTYNINQYRLFTGVKFSSTPLPPKYEAPAAPVIPDWASGVVTKAQAAGIKTPLTDSFGEMPIYQALLLIEKYMKQVP